MAANPLLSFIQTNLDAVTAMWNQDTTANQFIYAGNTYNGLIAEVKILMENELGGFSETLGTAIVISKTQLSTAPLSGQTLTANGKEMRIKEVNQDEVSFTLTCITATK